jgi:hypothetical protein
MGIKKFGDYFLVAGTEGRFALSDPVFRILGGAGLVSAPYIINMLINTIFNDDPENGTASSYNGSLTAGNCQQGLDQCMENFVNDIYGPAQTLISVVCFLVGALFCVRGIYRLAQAGQGGRPPSHAGIAGYFIGGAILISVGQFMDAVTTSVFGNASTGVFTSLAFNNNTLDQTTMNQANGAFMALFAFVQIIGWIGFGRGVYILIKLAQSESNRTHLHAFTHIICGVLAVNLYSFVVALQTTLGIQIVTSTTP